MGTEKETGENEIDFQKLFYMVSSGQIPTEYKDIVLGDLWGFVLDQVKGLGKRAEDGVRGFVEGINAAMERNKDRSKGHRQYTCDEMRLCVRVGAIYPEKLPGLTAEMKVEQLTEDNAEDITKKLGIYDCLPAGMKKETKQSKTLKHTYMGG